MNSIKIKNLFFSIILLVIVSISLMACNNNEPSNKDVIITKVYVEEHAKAGLTNGLSAEEVKEVFGKPQKESVDGVFDIFLYYKINKKDYQLPENSIDHEGIIRGDVGYEMQIVLQNDKVMEYQYFYKVDDDVWEFRVSEDQTHDNKVTSFDE